jgi:hypothetical protein
VCNSENRDVAVDDFGACGSKVLIVNIMNSDAHVICGADVTFVNWSQGNIRGKTSVPALVAAWKQTEFWPRHSGDGVDELVASGEHAGTPRSVSTARHIPTSPPRR